MGFTPLDGLVMATRSGSNQVHELSAKVDSPL
jgi:acetate kinase